MTSEKLNAAIDAIKAGQKSTAMRLLTGVVATDPNNEAAWLWLSTCVEETDRKEYCLKKVLAINPNNLDAIKTLAQLKQLPIPSLDELISFSARTEQPTPTTSGPVSPSDRIDSAPKLEPQPRVLGSRDVSANSSPTPQLGARGSTPLETDSPETLTMKSPQPSVAKVRVPWYRQTWFMLVLLLFFPLGFIILFLTDNRQSRSSKWGCAILVFLGFCIIIALEFGFSLYKNSALSQGNAELEKGNYDQAIADYTKAIELDPKDAAAYYNRGLAYYNQGKLDQAKADYDKAIVLAPKDAAAYYNRGLVYMQKGENSKAVADFQTYLQLNPNAAHRAQAQQFINQLK